VVRAARGSVCFVEHYTGSILQFDNEYAAELEDIISNPLPTGRYERIKAQLIRGMLLSEEQRACQLLMHEGMGGRSPTQFLRHLWTLPGPSVPSDFLFILWTIRLLPNIESIIAKPAQVDLDDVAQLGDEIAEVMPPPCVARVSSSSDDIFTLTARIDELARQVAALAAIASRPRSPSLTRWHARLSGPTGRSSTPDICWYHRRFKERAKRCTAPCTWQQGNMAGSR